MLVIQEKKYLPTFGYRLPSVPLTDARNIPNLVCANCGKNMMPRTFQDEFINSISMTAKDVINLKGLLRFKDSFGYKFLSEIASLHPNRSLEKSFRDNDVKDKLYLIKEFTEDGEEKLEEIFKLLNISKKYVKNSPYVINKIEKYKDRLPKPYQDLLGYMKEYALKYPDKTFFEIFTRKDVIRFHENRNYSQINKMNINIDEVIRKMSYLSIYMSKRDAIVYSALIKRAKEMTNFVNYPVETRRDALRNIYKPFLSKIEDKELVPQILEYIENLPMQNLSADSLILYLRTFDDKGIIKNIIDNITSTFEHIVPKSYGGHKSLNNGIFLCKKCNNERGNSSYIDMVRGNPNFIQNLQRQIDKIIVFINSGKLLGYQDYPLKVKKTFLDVTRGLVNLNIDKYIKHKKSEYIERFAEIKQMSLNNNVEINKTVIAIQSIDKAIKELENKIEILKISSNLDKTENEIQKVLEDIEFLKNQKVYLEKHKNKCLFFQPTLDNFKRTTEISQEVFNKKIETIY